MDECKRDPRDPRVAVILNRDRYRQLAAAKGWKTQTEQALAIGISQKSVSRIVEYGDCPGNNIIAALLRAFESDGETFDSLFRVVEDVPWSA